MLEEEEEEKEKEVVAGGSEGVLPETVVGNVKNSDSRPLGSGEEDNEPMDTSEGGGDGGGDRGEEEEGKKEDSSSQVVKKKDNSGIGTAEPTKKKKKQAHPFFGNAEACLIIDSYILSCGIQSDPTHFLWYMMVICSYRYSTYWLVSDVCGVCIIKFKCAFSMLSSS